MISPSRLHAVPLIVATLLGLWTARPAARAQTVYSHGDPTDPEQLALELINRARANPAAEGQRLGQSGFDNYPARPPLAFNAALLTAARDHNTDMVTHNMFSHYGSDGSLPAARVAAAGYPATVNVGENISFGEPDAPSSEDALMVDAQTADLGHRRNLLEYDVASGFYREIGGAYDAAGLYYTQDFAARGLALATGVAFHDTAGTGFYAVGEGAAGITVSSPQSSYVTVTGTSGGYALPLDLATPAGGGATVTFRNAAGAQYSRSLALAETTGDGAVDNVECNARVGIDLPDAATATISVSVSQATASAVTGQVAVIKLVRTGGDLSTPLTVNYKAKGTAVGGVDYKALSGTATIPAGGVSAKVKIKPRVHDTTTPQAVLKIVVKPGDGYLVGTPATAKVAVISGQ